MRSIGACQRGFSLIEIMVTLALVAIMIGGAVQVMRSSFESDGREFAKKLRSTIRYLYNQSALTGNAHRMVFALGDGESEQTITIEQAEGEFVRSVQDPDAEPEDDADDEAEPEEVAEDDPIAKAYADVEFTAPGETAFTPVRGPKRGDKPFTLPPSLYLYEVIVPGLPERIESGDVEMYFYPGGTVDGLTFIFGDELRERFFVVEVNPYTGLSRISRRYPEPES